MGIMETKIETTVLGEGVAVGCVYRCLGLKWDGSGIRV